MRVGYVRVSTAEQNTARQEVIMETLKVEKIFIDKCSGKNTNRPQLNSMLDFVREGDTVVIESLSRLGRSLKDLIHIKEVLDSKMVNLESKKEQIDTTTPTGRLLFNMVASIYQFEREILLERQKEGIAIAKANGKYKGRKEIKIDNFEEYYNRYMNREINKGQFAAELNISRPTLDKLINEHQNKRDMI